MMTPLDIHNKVFGRAFRGYKMNEVDAFLDEIIRDHEAFYRENSELKETVARMTDEAIKNREISMTLEKTMVLAQRVYEEEALRAKKEADIILWEAEKSAEKIIEGARKEVLDTRQRIERLRLYEKQLYLKHKGFLDFQMELLDGYKDKEAILTDGDMEKLVGGARERDLLADGDDSRPDMGGGVIPDVVSLSDDAIAGTNSERGNITAGGDSSAGEGIDDKDDKDAVAEADMADGADITEEVEIEEVELAGVDDAYAREIRAGDISAPENTAAPEARNESPFVVNEQISSMEQVVLLAQKMEEALKALDSMYGEADESDD